jgi:hypothetical protein
VKLNLSSQYFWQLTWYEWGFEVLRIITEDRKRISDQELLISLNGDFMALFANANRDPKKTGPFSRKDFYKLSYDTQATEEEAKNIFFDVAKRLGGTIKDKKK